MSDGLVEADDERPVLYLSTVIYLENYHHHTTISSCSVDDENFFTKHITLAGYTTNECEHMIRLEFVEALLIGQGIRVVRGIKKI